MFEIFILNTIKIGSLYALISMAFRLMFNVSPFFNISLGSIIVIASYMCYFLVNTLGLSPYLSFFLTILFSGIISYAIERLLYSNMRKSGASSMILLVVSLGLYMIFESVIDIIFGPKYRTLSDVMNLQMINFGDLSITITQIFTIVFSFACLMSLSFFVRKTMLGKQIQSIRINRDLSRTYGMKINTLICYVSILTGFILGATGIITIYETGVDPNVGFNMIFKGIIAALIGGFSISGAFWGAMLLAFAENLGVWIFASEWRDAVAFIIFILFLFIKPYLSHIKIKKEK